MNRKSKVFFVIMFFLILLSMFATYYRYMVLKDFKVIQTEIVDN